jgi:radical SAM protein with 4Fe4S-binding SPASM domain
MSLFIKQLTLATTYRCNSKCIHCNIWQSWKKLGRRGELSIHQYQQLLSSSLFNNLNAISLTGGEPLLYHDLPNLIMFLAQTKPGLRLDINTNGLSFNQLDNLLSMKDIDSLLVFQINISLDGDGEIHDRVRGIDGVYNKVIKWLSENRTKIKKNVAITLSFTATPSNFQKIEHVVNLANRFSAGLSLRMQQNSFFYDNVEQLTEWNENNLKECGDLFLYAAEYLENKYNRPDSPHVLFTKHAVNRFVNRQRDYSCFSGSNSLYLDPLGTVYPCIMLNYAIGSILTNTIDEILSSEKYREVLDFISARHCSCWTECETLHSISQQKSFFMKLG